MTAAYDHVVDVAHRIRESVTALGDALDAVKVYTEPAVARAVHQTACRSCEAKKTGRHE
jgi:hypothetical protein